ncbi:hypothetical protein ACIQM0_34550 [Streptomyces sp. NPDC091387]|uniref:hypothetical protein n=1 Tax=Streptomyces sp. NPDC091387 TaxID=3365998 RepID=UPI003813C942
MTGSQDGEDVVARREAREERDRLKAEFGSRLRVLLDLTGLSSREFAQRYPAYKDSTVRKYTLGTNLPPWDFLHDLLTEVTRRTDDPAGPQRRTELFTAYRQILVDTGADVRGSDQNSLLLRLLDGEEVLARLVEELAGVRARENQLRTDLQEETQRTGDSLHTGSENRKRQLEEESRALEEHRSALVHRRGDLITELDNCRTRLGVLEEADGPDDLPAELDRDREHLLQRTGGGDQPQSVPPPPLTPPQISQAPGAGTARRPRHYRFAGAALAFLLVAGGGVATGVYLSRGDSGQNPVDSAADKNSSKPRPDAPAEDSAPATESPTSTASPTATAEQHNGSLIDDVLPMESFSDAVRSTYATGAAKVDTRVYPKTMFGCDSHNTWELDRKYNVLVVSIGVADWTPMGNDVTFTVQIDGDTVKEYTMSPGDRVKKLSIGISGAFRISLGAEESAITLDGFGAWIDPVVTK